MLNYDPYGLFSFNDPASWPTIPSSVNNFSAGMGDVLTFGLGKHIRNAAGIGGVNVCSRAYSNGEWAGVVGSVATGFIGGTKAVAKASSKLGREFNYPLVDFSHSLLPSNQLKRMGTRFSRWLNKKGNRLNGDFVPRNLHWRMDPEYRTKWLTDAERAKHVPFGDLRGLINRMPYTPGAALYGLSSMGLNNLTNDDCGC